MSKNGQIHPEYSTGILRQDVRLRHGIVTHKDAVKRGLDRFFTGYPCFRSHIAERDTKTGKCVQCWAEDIDEMRHNPVEIEPFPVVVLPGHEVRKMHKEQNGLCAICDDPIAVNPPDGYLRRTANVDHCHQTGKIRGLLCQRCNSGLGMFKDSVDLFKRAISYLGGLANSEKLG